jgi:ribosome-associated toxin RatA of RatAB toxin-antitoxin module
MLKPVVPMLSRLPQAGRMAGSALLIAGLLTCFACFSDHPAQAASVNPKEMATLLRGDVIVKEENALENKQDKGPATVIAQIVIPRPPEQIWPVVVNPQDVMSEERKVKSIRILSKNANSLMAEYTVTYHRLLPTFNYTLKLDNKAPNMIQFRRISGSFKDIQGSWKLQPVENGQKTLLTYTLSIDPGFFAPKFMLVQAIKSDLPSMMKNVKVAIDKKVATAKSR